MLGTTPSPSCSLTISQSLLSRCHSFSRNCCLASCLTASACCCIVCRILGGCLSFMRAAMRAAASANGPSFVVNRILDGWLSLVRSVARAVVCVDGPVLIACHILGSRLSLVRTAARAAVCVPASHLVPHPPGWLPHPHQDGEGGKGDCLRRWTVIPGISGLPIIVSAFSVVASCGLR